MKLNLVELSHYNIPHIVEKTNQDWVSFGEDNLYPNYLLELFLGSAINGALIKSIGAMIYGEGLAATDADENEATKESFLKLNGLLHDSPDDVLKDLAMDLKLFGGCYVNVIWSRDRKSISKISHIGAQYIRSGKMVDGEIDTYYYSSDWSKFKKAEHKPRPYKAFNTKDRTQASQILMIRDKNPALFYGFAPDYVASTDYIQLDLEIAQFHLANISNGMFPSMAINFKNGVPSDDERRHIEKQINSKFSGSGNSGRILLTFNDGGDTTPEIVPLDTNNASESYQFLSKEVVNKVLSGHRVTSPLLFGIRAEGGGLGSNADELRDAFSLFNSSIIVPFQHILLSGLEKIFKVNDIHLDLYFKTLKPADFIDLEVTKTQSEEDQEKEGVSSEDIDIDSPIAETEEQTEKIEDTMLEPAENEASYNGAQISSAIDIIAKVGEGILTKEQATVFLIQFLQLSPEVAKGFFSEGTSAVEKLSEKINKKKSKKKFKDLQDIDTKPTKGMIEEAKKGLEWRKEYDRGGTMVAVARARNIVNNDNLSLDTISRMNSFFARHEVDKEAEGFYPGSDKFPSAGRIAWALWGGDAGQSWSAKKVEETKNVKANLSDDELHQVYDDLEGEIMEDDKWEVVDEREQGAEESYEDWAKRLIKENKKEEFADEIKSDEDKFSYLDKSFYRVRFKYAVGSRKPSSSSRTFCKNMMRLAKAGFVYRIEDIDKASDAGINRQLGHKGRKYDLFKFKGGVYCRHVWKEVLYRLKKGTELKDGQSLDDDYNTVKSIPKSYVRKPKGLKDSKIAPVNMPNEGHYPGVK